MSEQRIRKLVLYPAELRRHYSYQRLSNSIFRIVATRASLFNYTLFRQIRPVFPNAFNRERQGSLHRIVNDNVAGDFRVGDDDAFPVIRFQRRGDDVDIDDGPRDA